MQRIFALRVRIAQTAFSRVILTGLAQNSNTLRAAPSMTATVSVTEVFTARQAALSTSVGTNQNPAPSASTVAQNIPETPSLWSKRIVPRLSVSVIARGKLPVKVQLTPVQTEGIWVRVQSDVPWLMKQYSR